MSGAKKTLIRVLKDPVPLYIQIDIICGGLRKGFDLVKCEVGSHILSRTTMGGNSCEQQQSGKLKSERLPTYYHRMTPTLNVKGEPTL